MLRALEVDRERRWPDAMSFAAALEAAGAAAVPVRPVVSTSDRRRPRRRWIVALAFVLALALGSAAALAWYWRSQPEKTRVSDATGVISMEVPSDWARQVRDDGWSPTVAELDDERRPALEVSGDLAAWRRLDSDTPGVFVGLTRDARGVLPPPEESLAHMGCVDATGREGNYGSLRASVQKRSRCSGPWTLTEAGLFGAGFSVYVQIKQPNGVDRTEEILGSLRITPGTTLVS